MSRQKSGSSWFEPLSRIAKPSLRLFCIPYAGGSANSFRQWQRQFPPEVDLCLVHLPGRGNRVNEPAFRRSPELVSVLAEQIEPYIHDEFAFYGHSMGALISFELARELLRRRSRGPRHLFLSGSRAPQRREDKERTYDLPHDEFIEHLRKLNGTPEELLQNRETLELFMPTLRADFELNETYEYRSGPPLHCPMHTYGGLQDPDVSVEDLRAWQSHTTETCDLKMFEGNHFFIHSGNFIHVLKKDVLTASRLSGSRVS
jgi:medium-chain acyl-[acyl-carrier-protein] hydrolase